MANYIATRYVDMLKPGDVAGADYILEQANRGNLEDLVASGVLTIAGAHDVIIHAEPAPDYEALTINELRALVKERGVKVQGRKKANYVEALIAADNG